MPFLSSKVSYELWSKDENMEEFKTPPPKPQRGILRPHNPIVVPPGDSTPQTRVNSPLVCQFKGTERRRQLIEQLQLKLGIQKITETFTGREGMDAMIEVILENTPAQLSMTTARERAVKLLDLWLQESVIRPRDQEWSHEFQDDKKVLYLFNPPEQHRIVMTPRARSTSCDRKPSRKESFKSLFRFSSQDNNAEQRPTLFPKEDENVENARICGIRTRPIRMIRKDPELQDEAALFDAALRCILVEVEVPVLDDVLTVKDCRTHEQSMSFLSSILRRMGIVSEQKMTSLDEILDFVRSCTHLKRTRDHVINWFNAALKCAPALHVEKNPSYSAHSQIHEWVTTSLRAVIDNLSNITSNAKNPLVPVEFLPFLQAVCEQLCSRSSNPKKRDYVLHCIWLMIPSKLRRHLSDVFDFLQATANTDHSFNFRDPFFLNKQTQELGANFWFVVEELRSFILPQSLPQKEQMSIIELYLNLRRTVNLDEVPEELKQSLKKKSSVAFCHSETETDVQAQQRVIEMVEGIVKCNAFTPQRKREMLNVCRKDYPHIMSTFFPNL